MRDLSCETYRSKGLGMETILRTCGRQLSALRTTLQCGRAADISPRRRPQPQKVGGHSVMSLCCESGTGQRAAPGLSSHVQQFRRITKTSKEDAAKHRLKNAAQVYGVSLLGKD